MDGDARGGAALSVKAVTGKPIKSHRHGREARRYRAVPPGPYGKPHPRHGRCADADRKNRSLRSEAGSRNRQEDDGRQADADRFYDQLQKMKNMGSMEEMLGMLPGVDAKALAGAKIDEKQMAHTEAIIQSMTPKERDNPSIINYSRKKRIANGCGLSVEQVNKLLKQFEAMQKMTKQLTSMARSKGKKRRGFPGLGNFKLPF
ncbi:MAG: hypothetical protein ACLT4C_03280 [Butyricicoccus sp.]